MPNSYPISPLYLNTAVDSQQVLDPGAYPDIYTTTGPLPVENGLVFTTNSMAFDPNYVVDGTFDCGVFGSQA